MGGFETEASELFAVLICFFTDFLSLIPLFHQRLKARSRAADDLERRADFHVRTI